MIKIPLPYEENLNETPGLITLQNKMAPHHNFPVLKWWLLEDGGALFTSSHTEMTRENSYQLHQEKFHLDIRKKFFTTRTLHHWNNLPRDVIRVPIAGSF